MEIYQIVLMVIGAITLLWLVVKAVKGFFGLLDAGMAGAFREKYPDDFEIDLGWVVKEQKNKGFIQMATMDAGSDNPGIIMAHPESGCEMEIRLHAPLLSGKGFSIIVANHQNNTAIVMQDSASDENKNFLRKFLE